MEGGKNLRGRIYEDEGVEARQGKMREGKRQDSKTTRHCSVKQERKIAQGKGGEEKS